MHEWWNPYIFQGSYIISILEHVGDGGIEREHKLKCNAWSWRENVGGI